jgi:ATP-dependent RNA helicase DeaD
VDASWDDLPLSERARDVVHRLGWRAPTPIQALVVPQLAAGRDVIARAETGSGKTAAFGLVLADAVRAPGLQALVLAPTRELAVQIADELTKLAEDAPFRAVALHGGVPYDGQLAALRDPSTTCVVATTGRLLDFLAKRQVALDQVRFVVIDEADRMLDLGFLPEVERVLKLVPGSRQTALFTATMPKKVAALARRSMAHAREIEVGRATPAGAEHYRIDVPSERKLAALEALLDRESPRCALLFARTREGAHALARALRDRGYPALELHGDLDQAKRSAVVEGLRAGRARYVVATDVAARGLDFEDVTHVVNVDVPEEPEQYVHRAGRTARAGRAGRILTLVTESDGAAARAAEQAAKVAFRPYVLEGLTLDAPVPPRPERAGGNARGARRKRKPTAPRPKRPEAQPEEPATEREFDLPPSRRRRRA